jgi:hypothetical protein
VLPITTAALGALPAESRARVLAAWDAALEVWPAGLEELRDSIMSGAPETIDVAWKMVMDDAPLGEEVRQLAAALLTKGGGQGTPFETVIYALHPCLVLAVVLRVEGDPRASVFYSVYKAAKADTAAVGPVMAATYEVGGRAYTDLNAMLAAQERIMRRRRRLRPWRRCSLVRLRPREHRSRATGSRAPPDDDDDAELDRRGEKKSSPRKGRPAVWWRR